MAICCGPALEGAERSWLARRGISLEQGGDDRVAPMGFGQCSRACLSQQYVRLGR
jgi:hypothetical protein